MMRGMASPPEGKVLFVRNFPPDVARKLRGAAALNGMSLQRYLITVLTDHVAELERSGVLPKPKR